MLFPHLPCQAWPDGQLRFFASYTSGLQNGPAAREPSIRRKLMLPRASGLGPDLLPSRLLTLWCLGISSLVGKHFYPLHPASGHSPSGCPGTSFCQPGSCAELRREGKWPHSIETAALWECRSRGSILHSVGPEGVWPPRFGIRAHLPCLA